MIKLLIVMTSFFLLNDTDDKKNENLIETEESVIQDTYAVIATTKGIGQQYSINLRVTASCIANSCSVYKVEVATSYGYSSISYSQFGGEYSVNYNSRTYYFRF